MSLVCRRNEGETWRECALRYGRAWGLETDIAEYFDQFIAYGDSPSEACWSALLECDCLDYREDNAMTDAEIRLQCLHRARGDDADQIVKDAQAFYDFVMGGADVKQLPDQDRRGFAGDTTTDAKVS